MTEKKSLIASVDALQNQSRMSYDSFGHIAQTRRLPEAFFVYWFTVDGSYVMNDYIEMYDCFKKSKQITPRFCPQEIPR